MKKFGLFAVFIIIALLLTQAVSFAFAAPPEDKGPPTLEKAIFIHYRANFAPGKPDGTPGTGPVKPDKTKTTELYKYSKIHWPYEDAADGIEWYYNPDNEPEDFEQAMIDSFAAWDYIEDASINFADPETTLSKFPGWDSSAAPDGFNVVGWDNISSEYSKAIGITVVWYNRYPKGEKIIVECDTTLNSDTYYAWTWTQLGDDVDPNYKQIENTGEYDVDVQNIMTHEAGHWLMLGDMYDSVAAEQTMFGIAYDRELKKRSLEEGDIKGIIAIYP